MTIATGQEPSASNSNEASAQPRVPVGRVTVPLGMNEAENGPGVILLPALSSIWTHPTRTYDSPAEEELPLATLPAARDRRVDQVCMTLRRRETDSNPRSSVRERFSRLPRLSSPSLCRERGPGFESLFLHRRVSLREFCLDPSSFTSIGRPPICDWARAGNEIATPEPSDRSSHGPSLCSA